MRPPTSSHRVEEAPSSGLSWRELLAIAVLATVPRIAGLGHVSLWLDEILGTLQTSGSLSGTWEQLKGVRVHPPLWGLLNWLTQQGTEVEVVRRLVPVACGIAAILFLADLVCRRFDRTTAWLCAGIAAFSPLHIRYSQELRAYSPGLFLFVLALWALDRALVRERARDWVAFAAALWAGFSTLYLAAFVFLPGLILVLTAQKPKPERRRDLGRFALSVGAAGLAFAPWYGIVGEALEKKHERPATDWTLELVAQRWHFLTAASQEGERTNAWAVVIALVALAGVAAAWRSRAGRMALAGLVAGTLGVELVLVLLGHWSNGRYSLAAWPFLMMILALGCRAAGSILLRVWPGISGISRMPGIPGMPGMPGSVRRRGPVLVPLLALLLVVPAELLGVGRYYQHGRPDWLSLAREVSLAVPPPGTVRVANDWTRISLGYYLSQLEGGTRPGVSARVKVVGGPGEFAADPSCSLLVDAGYPERRDLDDLFGETPAQKSYPRTGARLLALPIPASAGSGVDPWRCFSRELEAGSGERSPSVLGIALQRGGQRARLEMVEADASQLLFGWSFAERNREGVSFRWMVGHWSAIRLRAAGDRLKMRAWSFEEGERLTVYRGRSAVAEVTLRKPPQDLEVAWPWVGPQEQGEIVHLHIGAVAPKEQLGRALAAGFDSIELAAGTR